MDSGKSPGTGKKDTMSGHEELRNGADWQAQLYGRYHQKVFGICLYFLKDREEAKDATHDVFIKAFRAWKEFKWKCDPLTWIGAIAKHDCFSRRMRRKRQMERRAELAAEEIQEAMDPGEELVLHRLRLEQVLPEARGKLRQILKLAMDGLNHREIAARMGVSRVAITRRLTRLRKELAAVGVERDSAPIRTASREAASLSGTRKSRPLRLDAPFSGRPGSALGANGKATKRPAVPGPIGLPPVHGTFEPAYAADALIAA